MQHGSKKSFESSGAGSYGFHRKPDQPSSKPNPMPIDLAAHLPGNLAARYRAAMQDQNLLSLRSEAVLAVVRQIELTERLKSGEAGALWDRLGEAAGEFRAGQLKLKSLRDQLASAAQAGDVKGVERLKAKLADQTAKSQQQIVAILDLIEQGSAYESSWQELIQHSRDVADFKEKENKRLLELRQFMEVREAMSFAGALIQAVRCVVQDRNLRTQIAVKMRSLLAEETLHRRFSSVAEFGRQVGIVVDQDAESSDQEPVTLAHATEPAGLDRSGPAADDPAGPRDSSDGGA